MASVADRDRLISSTCTCTCACSKTSLFVKNDSSRVEELQLDVRSDSNFRDSTEALQAPGSSSVRHVTVNCYGSFYSLWNTLTQEEDHDIKAFFRAIGSLSLESLSFVAGSYGSPVLFPAELLAEALKHSTNLERLKVHGLTPVSYTHLTLPTICSV